MERYSCHYVGWLYNLLLLFSRERIENFVFVNAPLVPFLHGSFWSNFYNKVLGEVQSKLCLSNWGSHHKIGFSITIELKCSCCTAYPLFGQSIKYLIRNDLSMFSGGAISQPTATLIFPWSTEGSKKLSGQFLHHWTAFQSHTVKTFDGINKT